MPDAAATVKRQKLFSEWWHCGAIPTLASALTRDSRFKYLGDHVVVMGRAAYAGLRDTVMALVSGTLGNPLVESREQMLIHGPMGTGKSHLLLLLMWDLLEEFEYQRELGRTDCRLIPILDCQHLIRDPHSALKNAFIWGFSGNEAIRRVRTLDTLDDLLRFTKQRSEKLVFLFDQWQALEAAQHVVKLLGPFTADNSVVIKVTSAGADEINRQQVSSHNDAFLYPLHEGLSEVS